jgi:GGDEF domain-containing protein
MTTAQHLTRNRFEVLLTTILERLARIELRLNNVAVDVDAIDRFNRPYGDGTRDRRRRGRKR